MWRKKHAKYNNSKRTRTIIKKQSILLVFLTATCKSKVKLNGKKEERTRPCPTRRASATAHEDLEKRYSCPMVV